MIMNCSSSLTVYVSGFVRPLTVHMQLPNYQNCAALTVLTNS